MGFQSVPKIRGTTEHRNTQLIRLHGQEFNIKLIWKGERYRGRKNRVTYVDGNRIHLYNDSVEVYSGKSFWADDAHKATARSYEYWDSFFVRLEHELQVLILKERKANITQVKAEFAWVENELAKACVLTQEKIRVYCREDGKLWFLIDNSFNLHEAETVHPQTAQQDMQDVVMPFFNDLKENKLPLPSEITRFIWQTQAQIHELAQAQLNTQEQLSQLIELKLQKRDATRVQGVLPLRPGERPDYMG